MSASITTVGARPVKKVKTAHAPAPKSEIFTRDPRSP
jgi:hypothetical protein